MDRPDGVVNSMSMKNKFYITTPIYYVTAKPHLGTLYSTLLADVLARWHRMLGNKVFFLTGTDEHGQKIEQAATAAGKKPKEFVDSFIPAYKQMWDLYDITYTDFIRTTDSYHVQAVQEWIEQLQKKGDIYKSFYQGWYCTSCETFVTEKEQDGATEKPACPSCNRATTIVSEETYFFKLSAYQERLLQFYQDNPDFIVPKERSHEVINFVKSGLKDLSISRTTVSWGIPFPGDTKHVTYVWADALNNYITAIGYGQPEKQDQFQFWWPADVQVLGKDIIRFHAVYWPAFLMASELPLPKTLLVHGWIKVHEQKMSKSLGNVIDPLELHTTYGTDAVRYYLMRQMAITQDGDFSLSDLEQKINTDLANDLGNLLNRFVSLAQQYDAYQLEAPKTWSESALHLRDEGLNVIEEVGAYMEDCLIHMALARVWRFINMINAYFHAQQPWKQVKVERAQFMQTLSATAHSIRLIGFLLWPVMPKKMEQLLESLGIDTDPENRLEELALNIWNKSFIVKKIPNLFEKIDIKPMAEKQIPPSQATHSDEISIDEVAKVQLRVGTIVQATVVENSDKLLQLQVDFGPQGVRTILAGVRKQYTPEELQGRQAVFVFNLKPRKMVGLESQGMMLFAPDEHGALQMIAPVNQVPNGTALR
jgi:methionyl-tRNA synthetase